MGNLEKSKIGPPVESPASEPVEPVEPQEEEIIDPPTDAHCPSCNGPGLRKGKTILCQICDCSFRYTKEGPKVEELGPFDKLAARVTKLEGGPVEDVTRAEIAAQADALGMESLTEDEQVILEQPVEPEDDGI